MVYFNSDGKIAVCGLCKEPLKHEKQRRCGHCYATIITKQSKGENNG